MDPLKLYPLLFVKALPWGAVRFGFDARALASALFSKEMVCRWHVPTDSLASIAFTGR
jgi:hypothetical protein